MMAALGSNLGRIRPLISGYIGKIGKNFTMKSLCGNPDFSHLFGIEKMPA